MPHPISFIKNLGSKRNLRWGWIIAAIIYALPLLLFSGFSVNGASYMKFDGIDGEANDPTFENWIGIESFEVKVQRVTGDGTVFPKVEIEPLKISKRIDKSSPILMQVVCDGSVYPKVEINLTRSVGDGSRQTYLKWELSNVHVSSYSISGSAGGESVPVDTISLNFEKIEFTYIPFDVDGKPGEPVIGVCEVPVDRNYSSDALVSARYCRSILR
ncbi:MAG: type VI secretion system tube protein Hcp [Verrucomicrobiales bacterium]